ncbi:hypothetical protein AB0N06_06890 [Streptomyces sp. NPDC051020]|uniref:hypothetical protein n=1 Tax=Streptomyces sp. NPDC051020 TaxID=3155409 RepID=UPI0034385E36
MTDEPRTASVRFDDNRLVLERYRDENGIYYAFPDDGRTAAGPSVALSLTEALHARVRPVGTAERVLRAWSQGSLTQGAAALDDPTAAAPTRVRGGAIVIRDRRMLLISLDEGGRTRYEITGVRAGSLRG